jgi:hypothetical protein
MEYRSVIASGKNVLFAGREHEYPEAQTRQEPGRWRISIPALDAYLNGALTERSFGASINRFVFCFGLADPETVPSFQATAHYTVYGYKEKEVWSVGQLRWTDVKDLAPGDQLRELRAAIRAAIERIGTRKRMPKDFRHIAFASAVDSLLRKAPLDTLVAGPSAIGSDETDARPLASAGLATRRLSR